MEKQRWSTREESELYEGIRSGLLKGMSIMGAIRAFAEVRSDRTFGGCYAHWYEHMRKQRNKQLMAEIEGRIQAAATVEDSGAVRTFKWKPEYDDQLIQFVSEELANGSDKGAMFNKMAVVFDVEPEILEAHYNTITATVRPTIEAEETPNATESVETSSVSGSMEFDEMRRLILSGISKIHSGINGIQRLTNQDGENLKVIVQQGQKIEKLEASNERLLCERNEWKQRTIDAERRLATIRKVMGLGTEDEGLRYSVDQDSYVDALHG